jgi:hypothetical protein
MVRDVAPIDVESIPGLAELVEGVRRTRRPQPIQRDGEIVALVIPAGHKSAERGRLPDQQIPALPPSPYRSLAEMARHQPVAVARTLTDEELKQAISEARAEAWRDHRR